MLSQIYGLGRRLLSKILTPFQSRPVRRQDPAQGANVSSLATMPSVRDVQHELEPQSNQSRPHCQHCLDLDRQNFQDMGYNGAKPLLYRNYRVILDSSIGCPYCKLLVDGIQSFDDINLFNGRPWELTMSSALLLKGNDNGKVHKLEYYVTSGTC